MFVTYINKYSLYGHDQLAISLSISISIGDHRLYERVQNIHPFDMKTRWPVTISGYFRYNFKCDDLHNDIYL